MTIEKEKISDRCDGCDKVAGVYCSVYLFPNSKWRAGNCPVATHLERNKEEKNRQRVGQQKYRRKR